MAKDKMEGLDLLKTCVNLLDDKHVLNMQAYDVRGFSPITDYFLVGSVKNERQMKAGAQNLIRQLKKMGVKPYNTDGELNSDSWVVVDYFDCIIHIFSEEAREFYKIESLWDDRSIEIDNLKDKADVKEK